MESSLGPLEGEVIEGAFELGAGDEVAPASWLKASRLGLESTGSELDFHGASAMLSAAVSLTGLERSLGDAGTRSDSWLCLGMLSDRA